MHDGSRIQFRKVPDDYDPTDRDAVYTYIRERQRAGEVATGLLYVEEAPQEGEEADFHGLQGTVEEPLAGYPFEGLCPGRRSWRSCRGGFGREGGGASSKRVIQSLGSQVSCNHSCA